MTRKEDWEREYVGQPPDEGENDIYDRRESVRGSGKIPKEGDTFYLLTIDDYLGEKLTVDSVGYDVRTPHGMVFGVVPYEDDSRSYEIRWDIFHEEWVALKEHTQATNA